ncbi:MAG: hypothetical protein Q7S29_05215 [Candidatus Peribacter sp.]|nr:hypothetical protein [Candidatus Peribacter sp.]
MDAMPSVQSPVSFPLQDHFRTSVRPVLLALLCGVLIVMYQVGCSVLIAKQPVLSEAYRAMGLGYDSNWYAGIMSVGYSAEHGLKKIANVAFMPGYPLLARPLFQLLSQPVFAEIIMYPTQIALLLTAQLCAVVAWMLLILLMRRFGVSPWLIALSILMILAQPFSFIMVWGYSESLFLAAVTGLLLCLTKPAGLRVGLIAQGCAFVASATRMHSLVLLVIPLMIGSASVWNDPLRLQWPRKLWYYGSIGVSALTGAVVFFSYLYWKFGDWLLYFHAQIEGWGHDGIGFLGIFNWRIYRPWWRLFVTNYAEGLWIDLTGIIVPVFTLVCLSLFIGSLVLAYKKRPEPFSGAVAVFVFGMLYLTIVGVGKFHDFGFTAVGLSRYEFPMMFLLFPFVIIQIRALFRKPFNLFAYGILGCTVIPLLLYHFYVLNLAVNNHLAL